MLFSFQLISMGLQQRWQGVFSGGYTLDIKVPICGSIANVSLIPTSTFGVASFGGGLYKVFICFLHPLCKMKLVNPVLCVNCIDIFCFSSQLFDLNIYSLSSHIKFLFTNIPPCRCSGSISL